MIPILKVLLVAFILSLVPAAHASVQWELQGDYSEGLAGVKDANGKWGYIDEAGKVVIPCQWNVAWSFKNGRALVWDSNNKEHYIDKTGKVVE